jgi:hypothetical protein
VDSNGKDSAVTPTRQWPRFSNLKDFTLIYEGRNEEFPVHPPDISPTGMFINTSVNFPEGAVLKVRFRLAKSNHPIEVRCEVRYCLTGVGIGVEFLGLSTKDQKAIKDETRIPVKKRARRKKSTSRSVSF